MTADRSVEIAFRRARAGLSSSVDPAGESARG